jgi:hypothetical protein
VISDTDADRLKFARVSDHMLRVSTGATASASRSRWRSSATRGCDQRLSSRRLSSEPPWHYLMRAETSVCRRSIDPGSAQSEVSWGIDTRDLGVVMTPGNARMAS